MAEGSEQGTAGSAELRALTRWLRARDPGTRLAGRVLIRQGLEAALEAAGSLPATQTLLPLSCVV